MSFIRSIRHVLIANGYQTHTAWLRQRNKGKGSRELNWVLDPLANRNKTLDSNMFLMKFIVFWPISMSTVIKLVSSFEKITLCCTDVMRTAIILKRCNKSKQQSAYVTLGYIGQLFSAMSVLQFFLRDSMTRKNKKKS